MAMPKVVARKSVTVDPVPAGDYPDLALMQLLVQTNPKTLKKSANIRMRSYNYQKKVLGPQGRNINASIDDLEAAGAEMPALQQALDVLGPLLGNIVTRNEVLAEIATVDQSIAALTEEEDDKALQAEKAALQEELATVETALGM